MTNTYIEGMRQAGRKVKLVHRIPFSSTTESLGATSVELEKLTRKAIENEANLDFIDGPVWAGLKYNWSHAHSTPKLVKSMVEKCTTHFTILNLRDIKLPTLPVMRISLHFAGGSSVHTRPYRSEQSDLCGRIFCRVGDIYSGT